MTTSRLVVLLGVMLLGLSTVFILPRQLDYQPVGIVNELPEFIGEWWGADLPVSEKERQVLGAGTEFSRKSYANGRGDEIQVSIVLAGHDMNTSIHRPERCLPAQGWTVSDKSRRLVAWPGCTVETTRLHNVRTVPGPDEKPSLLYNVNYYWFVGHTDVTDSHFERTLIDIRDRIVKGYNQRWAYITISATVTKNRQRFGRDEKETDQLIQSFVKQLVPHIYRDTVERKA